MAAYLVGNRVHGRDNLYSGLTRQFDLGERHRQFRPGRMNPHLLDIGCSLGPWDEQQQHRGARVFAVCQG